LWKHLKFLWQVARIASETKIPISFKKLEGVEMLDHTPRRSAFSTKRELLVCLSIPQNSKKQNPENRINMNKHEQTIHFQPVSDTKIVALHRFGACSSRWSTRRRSGPRHQKIDPQRSLNQPG
jgi:hypothetical protein